MQIPKILPGISSILGRISGFASLLDSAADCGDELPPRVAIQEMRLLLFHAWLNLPLESRLADLKDYAAECTGSHQIPTREWLDNIRSKEFVPEGVDQTERDLFVADIEALIALLRNRNR